MGGIPTNWRAQVRDIIKKNNFLRYIKIICMYKVSYLNEKVSIGGKYWGIFKENNNRVHYFYAYIERVNNRYLFVITN